MSVKCKMGIHQWDGCICTVCNKIRSAEHDTSEDCEKCSRCGTVFINQHDWRKDCEKCSICGKTREYGHSWEDNCEKCSICGKTRSNMHKMVKGVCTVCGHGIFEDDDKKQYQVIRIGDNVLMAENYARKPLSGNYWIYENENTNLAKYGFLYDFETAKNIAPAGWHLPSKEEWESVLESSGKNSQNIYENLRVGGHTGFDAVFAGWRSEYGNFIGENDSAHFWSSSKEGEKKAWQFKILAHDHKAGFEKSIISPGLSVRYFKDK